MNITRLFIVASICLLLTSCYSSHITVGNMTHDHPVKTVGAKNNHYLFWGLIPLSQKQEARDFVGDAKHYKIRTSHKFLNVLLSSLTAGIYSPVTVTYYMSEFDADQRYKSQRSSFDDRFLYDDDFEEDQFRFEDDTMFKESIAPKRGVPIPKKNQGIKQNKKPKAIEQKKVTPSRRIDDNNSQSPNLEMIRRQIQKDRMEYEKQLKEIEELKKQINK